METPEKGPFEAKKRSLLLCFFFCEKRRQKRREKKKRPQEKQKKKRGKGGVRFFPHTQKKEEEKVFPLQKLSLQYIRRRRERGFFFLENICSWWKVDRNARARTGSTTPGRTKFPDGRCAKKENFFFPSSRNSCR